ncbi:MAG TPA: hypothetical protein VFV81_01885, partial [Verrucomicrobiae bacterium]|nr:hypothetical protein [Verrucomicrobiae bacterium]
MARGNPSSIPPSTVVLIRYPSRSLVETRESFTMAFTAVMAHKLRSALTLLGVLIGVFSIIVVM